MNVILLECLSLELSLHKYTSYGRRPRVRVNLYCRLLHIRVSVCMAQSCADMPQSCAVMLQSCADMLQSCAPMFKCSRLICIALPDDVDVMIIYLICFFSFIYICINHDVIYDIRLTPHVDTN